MRANENPSPALSRTAVLAAVRPSESSESDLARAFELAAKADGLQRLRALFDELAERDPGRALDLVCDLAGYLRAHN